MIHEGGVRAGERNSGSQQGRGLLVDHVVGPSDPLLCRRPMAGGVASHHCLQDHGATGDQRRGPFLRHCHRGLLRSLGWMNTRHSECVRARRTQDKGRSRLHVHRRDGATSSLPPSDSDRRHSWDRDALESLNMESYASMFTTTGRTRPEQPCEEGMYMLQTREILYGEKRVCLLAGVRLGSNLDRPSSLDTQLR